MLIQLVVCLSIGVKIVRDVKATRLTSKLSRPIKDKAGKLADGLIKENQGDNEWLCTVNGHYQEVSAVDDNNTKFCSRLNAILTTS